MAGTFLLSVINREYPFDEVQFAGGSRRKSTYALKSSSFQSKTDFLPRPKLQLSNLSRLEEYLA